MFYTSIALAIILTYLTFVIRPGEVVYSCS